MKTAGDFTRCTVAPDCVGQELKPLGFIASLSSENVVVPKLITFGHSHKGVSMWTQICTGAFVYFGIWLVIYDLRVLLGFLGSAQELCPFAGRACASHRAESERPVRNALQIHEMHKAGDYDTDLATHQCMSTT